jgi:cell division septation protein DedD
MMQVFRVVSAALFAAVFSAAPLAAQPLAQISGPREQPPADYSANQYVDSAGCVFMRAGVGAAVTWVPRLNRERRLVCGYPPSRPGGAEAAVAAATAPAAEPVRPAAAAPAAAASGVPVRSPAPAAAPAPAIAPAPTPAITPTPTSAIAAAAAPGGSRPAGGAAVARVQRAARLVRQGPIAGAATACPDPRPVAQRFLLSDGRRVTRCGAPVDDAVGFLNGLGAPGLVVAPGPASATEARRALALDRGAYRVVWAKGDLARRQTVDAPTGAAPTGAAPTGAAPTGAAPTGAAPTGAAPTGAAPTGAAPTGAAPTGAAPTGAAPTGAARTAATASSMAGRPYYVQVGAFAVAANADRSVARLKALGLPVAVARERKGSQPLRTVLAGPFGAADAAAEARARLRAAGYPEAILRR